MDPCDVPQGDEIQSKRGVFKHSIAHNFSTIWDYVAKFWHHIPYNEIRSVPEQRPTVCA